MGNRVQRCPTLASLIRLNDHFKHDADSSARAGASGSLTQRPVFCAGHSQVIMYTFSQHNLAGVLLARRVFGFCKRSDAAIQRDRDTEDRSTSIRTDLLPPSLTSSKEETRFRAGDF